MCSLSIIATGQGEALSRISRTTPAISITGVLLSKLKIYNIFVHHAQVDPLALATDYARSHR